jgi:hypothetical protein
VRVVNNSEVDAIQVNTLHDSKLGNLGNKGTCDVPAAPIAAGGSYQCSFTDMLSGEVGDIITRRITATGVDDDLTPNEVSGHLDIDVPIIEQQPERIYLAAIADDVVEPNDSCIEAYPVQLNRQYFFLADDIQDVYHFTLKDSQSVRVEMTNFVPLAGQLVVWTGECGALTLIGRNPDTALNKTVDLGSRPAGFYVIQIINDGPLNDQDRYGLIVRPGQ